MYFNDKGNTDIDEDLKYDGDKKARQKARDLLIYMILGIIFLLGIVLIIVGINSYR